MREREFGSREPVRQVENEDDDDVDDYCDFVDPPYTKSLFNPLISKVSRQKGFSQPVA